MNDKHSYAEIYLLTCDMLKEDVEQKLDRLLTFHELAHIYNAGSLMMLESVARGVEASSKENLLQTLHSADFLDRLAEAKREFPEILCANERECQKGAAPFYTNSTQLPVNYTDDIFETLMLQDELQSKYTGGTVLHIYLGEAVSDVEAIKGLIRKIVTNYRLPYFTLTPTFSVCPSHGYLNGEHEKCSVCHEETEIYSRVVGYLRPVKQWNNGKQAEFELRKTFKVA